MHAAAGYLLKTMPAHFPCLTDSRTVMATMDFGQNIFLIDDIPGRHQPEVARLTGPPAPTGAAKPCFLRIFLGDLSRGQLSELATMYSPRRARRWALANRQEGF